MVPAMAKFVSRQQDDRPEATGWCEILGIEVPDLRTVKNHREAKPYSLLIVALLERGEAMTLPDVAARFEAAGAPRSTATTTSIPSTRTTTSWTCGPFGLD